MPIEPPAPPYVGPARHTGSGGTNKPILRVVIHATVSPCEPGGARNVAAYFRGTTNYASAHYVVDPGEAVQVVYDSVTAYHAPPNQHSLGIELCDPMRGSGRRWADADHQRMLHRAAELVAGLCLAYDVPIRKLDATMLRAGRKGICGHADVSDAWHETDHYDPGTAFDWPDFMTMVRQAARRLDETAVVDAPTAAERTRPTLVRRARRLLRRARSRADDIHRRRAIGAALGELPER